MDRTPDRLTNLSDISRLIIDATQAGYPPMLYINGQYYGICLDLTDEEAKELKGATI